MNVKLYHNENTQVYFLTDENNKKLSIGRSIDTIRRHLAFRGMGELVLGGFMKHMNHDGTYTRYRTGVLVSSQEGNK